MGKSRRGRPRTHRNAVYQTSKVLEEVFGSSIPELNPDVKLLIHNELVKSIKPKVVIKDKEDAEEKLDQLEQKVNFLAWKNWENRSPEAKYHRDFDLFVEEHQELVRDLSVFLQMNVKVYLKLSSNGLYFSSF